mgnify:CR=1 FL=1
MRIAAISLFATFVGSQAIAETGLGRDGARFTYDGKPVYLVGFDTQELACHPSLDYERALDEFVQAGVNKTRVWVYCWFGTTRFNALTPWLRDAQGRHDLDQWDPQYWQRLRQVIAAAEQRRIVVEVTIFAPYPSSPGYWWSDPEFRNAWNRDFNINGAFSANADGHFYPQFFDLTHSENGKRLYDYQYALVAKTIAELGRFTNVYFEIANEFAMENVAAPAGGIDQVHAWQQHWAATAKKLGARMVAVHADSDGQGGGAQHFNRRRAVDVLNFRLHKVAPEEIAQRLEALRKSGKAIAINESVDYRQDVEQATRYAWGMLLAGGYFAAYEDKAEQIGSAAWRDMARRLSVLRQLAEASGVAGTVPKVDGGVKLVGRSATEATLVAGPDGRALGYFARPGNGEPITVMLPRGPHRYMWYDVRDGQVLSEGTVAGGSRTGIALPQPWPGSSGAALLIRRG